LNLLSRKEVQGKLFNKNRHLQKHLNNISPENLNYLLEKLKESFKDLMNNIYGNYFSQKLFQCCIADQRVFILKHVIYF
jgi:hypothetical protein